jgi:serine/threonine protein kinase/lipopolysaccharide biosynthesis regulator YciM
MNPSQGVETVFAEALSLPPENRAAYLVQSTEGDPELRRRVESLLQSYEDGDFLEEAARPKIRDSVPTAIQITEKPGDNIGRYKLLQQIGVGGCGVVYMAEQVEPVRRRVALKIIKLGMDTKSVVARFEAERQALAMMDHPNIAKVLDAGATATGRPYFVMELVRGVRITEFCDEKKLSTDERLDLFIQVCAAIQHAHQKGIIHRDIKPSNILVSVNDGLVVPKVIDFGIAKVTGGQLLTNKTVFTAFEQFIGTPAYMSPEQALISNVDIDTRSDIYALGVLLYELLTGKTPFDTEQLLAIGLDEMRRTIREQAPQGPSTRVSTLPGQDLSTTAQRRGLDAPKLVSELRGDLDWIVMKALEKDRSRRYDTANSLVADIQRHLNNEPVLASPPSNIYRLRKIVRRNKVACAAGLAVAASLVVGATLSTILFFRERSARKQVSAQEAASQTVIRFLQMDLLGQADSSIQAGAGFTPTPNLTVREALERAAERIGDRFKDQPLQEAELRYAIGSAFIGVGEPERAVPQLERSVHLARATLGSPHIKTLGFMNQLARAYHRAGKFDQAVPLFEETLKLRTATLGPEHRDTLGSINNLALAYGAIGRGDQEQALYEQTFKLMNRVLSPDDPFRLNVMINLGNHYRASGKFDQAVRLDEETTKLRTEKLGPKHPDTLMAMNNLALSYKSAGRIEEALSLFEKTEELSNATLGPCHPDRLMFMANLADLYQNAGQTEKALPLLEQMVKLKQATLGSNHPDTLALMNDLAVCYQNAGRMQKALPLFEEMVKLRNATLGPSHPDTLMSMESLGDLYRDAGRLDEAAALFEETTERRKATFPAGSVETLSSMRDLGSALAMATNYARAEIVFQEALTYFRSGSSNSSPTEIPLLGVILQNLAQVLRDEKKLADARSAGEEAINLYHRHPDWPRDERAHAFWFMDSILKEIGDSPARNAMRAHRMQAFREAADIGDVEAMNNLAWDLATSTDPSVRDGRSAVRYAETAAKLMGKIWQNLDTLAAAYAEAGEFVQAASVQREAIDLSPDQKTKDALAGRLKLYESNTPFRE